MSIGKVTSKSQITIPKEIAKAINLKAQTWFWTKKCQEGEKQADDDIKAGRVKSFNSVEELMTDLND